jgi:type IV pilus assembly protein PilW
MHTTQIHGSSYGLRGFTLVELMIALAIGMLMSFGLFRVFANSSETYQALSQTAQQIENGRYAIQTISDDLRLAGYYGEYAFAPPAAGAALPDPCTLVPATMRAAIGFYVQAYNNIAAAPACLTAANVVLGTDVLVVRRVNTAPAGSLNASEVYMQANSDPTDPANPILALGSGAFTLLKKDGVTAAEIRKYHVHIYFVSPCNVPAICTGGAADDGGRPIPTLKRMTIAVVGGALTQSIESIAEGIETVQIDYGVDTDGDGMPDGNFLAAPATVPAWSDVMSAQIHVLARTPEQTIGLADTKTYTLGTAPDLTPGGRFRRHVFTSHVRLVNPAGRRETP